jgi:hypothetical protein
MSDTARETLADVSVVITFRAADEHRVLALGAVLKHYAQWPMLEVILVEQAAEPERIGHPLPHNVQHHFVFNPGAFNKSWGMNVGARMSTRAVLLCADADTLLAPDAVEQSARLCRRRFSAVRPCDRWLDLDATESAVLATGMHAPNWQRTDARNTRREHEVLNFCAGAFLVRREAFIALGGFDERFQGWGGEDDAMALKLRRSGHALGRVADSTVLHLWHPHEQATTFQQTHYANNVAMLNALAALDDTAFRFLCEVQRQLLGNPRKYTLASTPVRMPAAVATG